MPKQTKVLTRRRKFVEVDIPLTNQKLELVGNSVEDVEGQTIKLDMTRQLKGKGVEIVVKVTSEKDKAVANPVKLRLMSYFIRRIMRKRISYVEDSFETPSAKSMLKVKPFLITRNKVSRAVRKALRNKAKNWLEDYIARKKDVEIFEEILGNKIQKPLSLMLKKTYPLSFCEIRVLEILRPLKKDEIKEVKKKVKEKKEDVEPVKEIEGEKGESETEKIKKAEEEIKKTQKKVTEKEKEKEEELEKEVEEIKEKTHPPTQTEKDISKPKKDKESRSDNKKKKYRQASEEQSSKDKK